MQSTEKFDVFPGIGNENEFYSHHFLAHVFQTRIKGWLEQRPQDEQGEEAADRRLSRLAAPFFQQHARYPKDEDFATRLRWHQDLHRSLLKTVGFSIDPQEQEWIGGQPIPIWAQVGKTAGLPDVLVIPAFNPDEKSRQDDQATDPLGSTLCSQHFKIEEAPASYLGKDKKTPRPLAEILSDALFAADHPPRFVLLIGEVEWVLIDRFKWPANRFLRFDLSEILGKKPSATLNACYALLHREALCPGEGEGLLDTLDAESHKHDAGVSENLKYALREAIELLGNEAARQLIQAHGYSYTGTVRPLDDSQLSTECVRLVYRLIFLFYIEARPELGYVPINKSDVYSRGYSLEHLRDLTLTDLHSTGAQNGRYFDKTLKKLFTLVAEGSTIDRNLDGVHRAVATVNAFELAPLDSKLFDPASTPLLNRVVFPNHLWQSVLRGLSFAKDEKTRRTRRVSYQALSINQLGAVYESLLSYRGFFASEDLYEVMPAPKKQSAAADDADPDDADSDDPGDQTDEGGGDYGGTTDLLGNGWFVTKDKIGDYKNSEKVTFTNTEGREELRVYPKGSFIYRLAGRDRQKSASYYTHQSLTQCLVKYALKELLEDKSADDILALRVLEPAMGSAAFLNEAVNQLAEAYLTGKQQELKRRIPHDEYAQELQKVRMRLADGNVFGVDLNPIATELAEVSLWLNAIYGETDDTGRPKPARVPWFGYQLFNGNSLVGARPEVFRTSQLNASKKIKSAAGKSVPNPQCYVNAVPRRVTPGAPRGDDEIYHFLLPDDGMCDYAKKAVKEFFGAGLEQVKAWKKPLLGRFSDIEIRRLQQLSGKIDALWQAHARQLANDRDGTEDPLPVWPDAAEGGITSRASKEETRKAGMLSQDGDTATPYRRLKLVMDYWCALWFWPLDQADTLPSRTQWITEVGAILDGNVMDIDEQSELDFSSEPTKAEQQLLAPEPEASLFDDQPGQPPLTAPTGEKTLHDRYGELRIKRLREHFPRAIQVEKLADRFHFFHWELSFADLFRESGGFDLILGNPPWLKVEWEERGILGEADPRIAIRKMSASELARRRAALFEERPDMKMPWLDESCEQAGMQAFLNATQNYPLLKGVQTNLYKCFLPQAWMLGDEKGISGFLHPEGVYDDAKGGRFRGEIYQRLDAHYQFLNKMKLFPIGDSKKFSINVSRSRAGSTEFKNISNLFVPRTVDACYSSAGDKSVGGIKDEHDHWNLEGHPDRILHVDETLLALFAKLYDETGTPPRQARLPALHARQLISVLEKFAAQPRRLGELKNEYFAAPSTFWHEHTSQRDGTIRRETRFAKNAQEWVLSGPHFFVGNPFHNTPRAVCNSNQAYNTLDLSNLPDDYLPRTNYVPGCPPAEYADRTPRVHWLEQGEKESKRVTEYYRVIASRALSQSGERTLQGCLMPAKAAQIDGVFSAALKSSNLALALATVWASIPMDFFVKSTGKSDFRGDLANRMAIPKGVETSGPILARGACLVALTTHYADVWQTCYEHEYHQQRWSSNSPLLDPDFFANLTPTWQRDCALRSDYARRQALVEIDVLVAQAFGLALDELLNIYRIQFWVLRGNEADTWYDRNGRIVFTPNTALRGIGLPRKAQKKDLKAGITYGIQAPDRQEQNIPLGWEDIRDLPTGCTVSKTFPDDTLPGGPVQRTIEYQAPFIRPDREEDYRVAWQHFARQGG